MASIAIDWGAARVGVAVSQSNRLATPLCIIRNEDDLVSRLCDLIREHDPTTVVIGLPSREHETSETRRIRELANDLGSASGVPVVLWDETYSSVIAEELRDQWRRRTKKKKHIDDQAAAVILQSWIDAGGPDHQ